jgi:transcriptional regulator with XRE-family HTH domain
MSFPRAFPRYFLAFFSRWDAVWPPRARFTLVRERRGLMRFHWQGWLHERDEERWPGRWRSSPLRAGLEDSVAWSLRIMGWRQSLGLTQDQMAQRLQVSRAYLCDLEKGRRQPGTFVQQKLESLLQKRESGEAIRNVAARVIESPASPVERRAPDAEVLALAFAAEQRRLSTLEGSIPRVSRSSARQRLLDAELQGPDNSEEDEDPGDATTGLEACQS